MFTFTHRNPEMQLDKRRTALVLADIQNEFLAETGSYYPMIADSLKAHKVLDRLEELMKCAQENGYYAIHSPHYYYPTDRQWVAAGGAIADYLAPSPRASSAARTPSIWTGSKGPGPTTRIATRSISWTGGRPTRRPTRDCRATRTT